MLMFYFSNNSLLLVKWVEISQDKMIFFVACKQMTLGNGLRGAVQCSTMLNAVMAKLHAIKYSSNATIEDKLTLHAANNFLREVS